MRKFLKRNSGVIAVLVFMATILILQQTCYASGVDDILAKLNDWWNNLQKLFRRIAEIAIGASLLSLITFIAISKSEQGISKAKRWLIIDSVAAAGLVIWEMWLAIFK